MRFDPLLPLMIDRTQGQIVLQILEDGFHLGKLNVKLPQFLGGAARGDMAAQQIATFSLARLPQFVLAQAEGKLRRLGRHGGLNQSRAHRIIVQRGPQFLQ